MACNKVEDLIKLAKCDDYKVCVWGAGYVGTNYGYELLKQWGINIDFYCDNNVNLHGTQIKDGIICISPNNIPINVVCFVLTSGHLIADIKMQLTEMGIINVVTYMELCEHQSKTFFEFQKKNQIAIYTCVVGGYDEINEPKMVEEKCDYYIISDKKPEKDSVYRYININEVIEGDIHDDVRKNRYCKINAHKIFNRYRYSVYIDGNIVLNRNITKYIQNLPRTRIITLAKVSYKSIYAEALRCMMHGRDDKERFLGQVEKYWLEGMPDDFGLAVPAIMIREHNNPVCRKLMADWWDEINKYSKRDMISLSYVLWKNGYTIEDVGTLSHKPDVIDGDEWVFKRNHGKSRIGNK